MRGIRSVCARVLGNLARVLRGGSNSDVHGKVSHLKTVCNDQLERPSDCIVHGACSPVIVECSSTVGNGLEPLRIEMRSMAEAIQSLTSTMIVAEAERRAGYQSLCTKVWEIEHGQSLLKESCAELRASIEAQTLAAAREHAEAENRKAHQSLDTYNAVVKIENSVAENTMTINNNRFEIGNLIQHLNTSILTSINELQEKSSNSSREIASINESFSRAMSAVGARLVEEGRLHREGIVRSETEQAMSEVRCNELCASIEAQISKFALSESELRQHIVQQFSTIRDMVSLTSNSVAECRLLVEKYGFENGNLIQHLTTSTSTRFNEIQFRVLRQVHEVIALQLRHPSAGLEQSVSSIEKQRPIEAPPFTDLLERAAVDFPHAFPAWHDRLAAVRQAFDQSMEGNAANERDPYSCMFSDFVRGLLRGKILDVGAGVYGCPYYLKDYPQEAISCIEPLTTKVVSDCEFVHGIGEYIPWSDRTFDTVISATSLDHCLSLERSLDEVARVLKHDGRFLLWIGSVDGALPYDSVTGKAPSVDQFHLFHFDTSWLEPILLKQFKIDERIEIDHVSHRHIFYCLGLRTVDGEGSVPVTSSECDLE